jgi:hypothetical protein
MSDFDKYKTHLCVIAKDPDFKNKKFAVGFTSEVYRVGDFVIKELFLNETIDQTKEALREIEANIFLKENPDLHPYIVKFEGFDICDSKLYMKFPYEGKNLSEIILDFPVAQLYEIVKEVDKTLDILNAKIVHGDTKIENIYATHQKDGTFKIIFSDWGAGSFNMNLAANDKKYFRRTLKERLLMVNLFKKQNTKYLLQLLENKGLKKKFLYSVNKTMEFRMKMHHYRPKEFMESQRPIFFNTILFGTLLKEYGEEFIRKKAGINKSLSDFLDSIEVKKVIKSSEEKITKSPPKKSVKELIKSSVKKTTKLSIKKVVKSNIRKIIKSSKRKLKIEK